jgi:hypothetical protein
MALRSGSVFNFRVFGTIAIIAALVAALFVSRWFGGNGPNGVPAQTVRADVPKAVSPGADIRVSGWAACVDANSPVTEVDLLIDTPAKGHASLGFPRPDVAEAL